MEQVFALEDGADMMQRPRGRDAVPDRPSAGCRQAAVLGLAGTVAINKDCSQQHDQQQGLKQKRLSLDKQQAEQQKRLSLVYRLETCSALRTAISCFSCS